MGEHHLKIHATTMAEKCTHSSEGYTKLDSQLYLGKFIKKRSTGDTEQLSEKMANTIIYEDTGVVM